MKIGILTFHCAHNYGAVLQAFSLQEYLKSLGHEVYLIDYRPNYITKTRDYLRFSLKLLITKDYKSFPNIFVGGIKLAKKRNRRWKGFHDFITKELNLYKPESNFKGEGFDLCIVGSDQIWNKTLTGGKFEPLYFGKDFVCPVVSYAASTITKGLSSQDRVELKELLSNLTAISVRENNLRTQLQNFCNQKIDIVVDPTLLVDESIFTRFSSKMYDSISRPYLLVYTIKEFNPLYEKARELAAKENLRVIEISSTFNLKRYSQKLYDVSVEEFIALFKNAKFILTNSFHGTAFSLILRKDFYSVRQNIPQDERIENVLTQLNLSHRFLSPDQIHDIPPIDYSDFDKHLSKFRNHSREYLLNTISKL